MKKAIRLLALVLPALLLLAACGPFSHGLQDSSEEPVLSGGVLPGAGAQIALVGTAGTFDTTFMQSVSNTLNRFAGEEGFSTAAYKIEETSADAALATMELAAKGGAQLVVAAGELMEDMVRSAQAKYPDIDFILFSPTAGSAWNTNVATVKFAADQGGWLAGYAAVTSGARGLAFFLSQDAMAQQCALGFLLGADAAAEDLALAPGAAWATSLALLAEETPAEFTERVTTFLASGEVMLLMNDTTVEATALQAARETGQTVIGTGMMQSPADETLRLVIGYEPRPVLEELLSAWKNGAFPGGGTVRGTVENGAVALVMSQEAPPVNAQQYDEMLEQFSQAGVEAELAAALAPNEDGVLPSPWELPLSLLRIV